MVLSDLCMVKTDFPEADFWLVSRGSLEDIGKPVKEYSPHHIGIKVERTDVLVPDYLYYVFLNLFYQGTFQLVGHGETGLKHLRVSDIRKIPLGQS